MRSTYASTGAVVRSTHTDGKQTVETGPAVSRTHNEVPQTGSPIDTIRSPFGIPRSGADVHPTDLIDVHGYTMEIRAAEKAGFLSKDAQGNYYQGSAERGQAKGQQQQASKPPVSTEEQPQAPAAEVIPALDEVSEGHISKFVTLGNMQVSNALSHIIDKGTEVPPDLLAQAGSQLGIEAPEVAANMATVQQAFTKQAHEAVGESVITWAKSAKLGELREAARNHVMTGSTKGYASLERSYMSSLPTIDPAMILRSADAEAAGVQRERDGTISIFHPKAGRVSWSAAIKAGLIAPKIAPRRS